MELKTVLKYLNYRLTAFTEHDLHSPFMFNFYMELIKNNHPFTITEVLEWGKLRKDGKQERNEKLVE